MIKILLQNQNKYLFIIFIFTLLVGFGLAFERYLRSDDFVVKTNKIIFQKSIVFKYSSDEQIDIRKMKSFNYKEYSRSYVFLRKFYEQSKDKFSYDKFCLNWENLKIQDKLEWFRRHFFVANFGENVVQYGIVLPESDNKDYEYSINNISDLMDSFILSYAEDMKKINNNVTLTEIGSSMIGDNDINKRLNKKDIYIKYGIIGCLLGFLLGIIICMIDISRLINKK
jgi:hypothetical protein